MRRNLVAVAVLGLLCGLGGEAARAQNLDDLNLQVHGYVTQGFIYTNHNSWNTTDSENGSAAWTEAVINLSLQPQSKLRIGVQGRYYLMGDIGNQFILDWAQLDYKVNEHLGFRAGDVKTPMGLLNETQDIDPANLWVLLPQSVYPIASRNSILDHFGGVVYGSVPLGESLGKLEYRGFGGERVLGGNDGYFQTLRDEGLTLPHGTAGPIFGGTLRWNTPIRGLMLGASEIASGTSGEIVYGGIQGMATVPRLESPYLFGKYERGKVMLGGEYNRLPGLLRVQFPGPPAPYQVFDERSFYLMASYKLTGRLTGGAYYSSWINRPAPLGIARFQKDWVVAGRYDFNSFLYAKAEEHFIDGTATGFSASDNPNLQPKTSMTMLKLGVSF